MVADRSGIYDIAERESPGLSTGCGLDLDMFHAGRWSDTLQSNTRHRGWGWRHRRVTGVGRCALGFGHLEEINDLFFHIWDAAILRCLLVTGQPMRYSDIGSAVDRWSQHRRPSDSDLTRSLDRLRKAGFVHRTDTGNRRSRIYTLTSTGRERASKIGALISLLEASAVEDELSRAHEHVDGSNSGDGPGGGVK